MAYFNNNPYCIFSLLIDGIHHEHFLKEDMVIHLNDDFYKFWFASNMQKFSSKPEELGSLISVFEEIWLKIDLKKWKETKHNMSIINISRQSWMR